MLDTCLCFPREMEPGYCFNLPRLTMVIEYIVEYCTCTKLKMAKWKLQTELSLQQKSEVLL
jgi:hypothetical protein